MQGPGDGFSDDSESLSQPQAPDVGEALQQLDQRFAAIEDRLDAEPDDQGYEEDDWDPDPLQYNPAIAQPEDDQNEVLSELLSEEVAEQVKPYVDAVENSFREQQILQLAERYPALREPETLDAVSSELEQFAQAYGAPGALTDPRLIEQFLVAHLAQQAVEEAPEPSENGATLETGTGPGEPQQEEVDPTTRAWLNAAMPDPKRDVFS